jgi:tetratricopeptide (TPR) repeat protein
MDELLARLRALTKQNLYDEAVALCDASLASTEGADRARLWRLRSYVHQQMKRYDAAVEDIAAGLSEHPEELSLLFERATVYLELRRFAEANADLEQLLGIEQRHGGDFFEGAAHLLQAICLNKLARPADAIAVSTRLSRDARTWALGRLWTPDELEAESRAQI